MASKFRFETWNICFNEKRAFDQLRSIYTSDRWFTFPSFERTAAYVYEQMQTAGLAEVELTPGSADGHTRYGDYVIPQAWDARNAQLSVVSPVVEDPLLADYLACPCSLMMFSAPTQASGVIAPVIRLDDPASVSQEQARGKIIFTHQRGRGALVEFAKAAKALGVISDWFPAFPDIRDTSAMEDANRWENNLFAPVNTSNLFGFSISPRKGRFLQKLIDEAQHTSGEVKLLAQVETRLYDGVVQTLSGAILGSEPGLGEILVCGHLYEQGANDNATGCAVILELAQAIQSAVRSRKIPPPRRTIRFVMGYECQGMMVFATHHPEILNRSVAALNLDMVGSAVMDRARVCLIHNPWSSWSAVDALMPALIREYKIYSGEEFAWEQEGYEINDNLVADPSLGVPSILLMMHPAESYHSSLDTPERVDPQVLKRFGILSGAYIDLLSNPDPPVQTWLEYEFEYFTTTVLSQYHGDAFVFSLLSDQIGLARKKLPGLMGDSSMGRFVKHQLQEHVVSPGKNVPLDISQAASQARLGRLIPKRQMVGPVTFFPLKSDSQSVPFEPYYDYPLNCPLYWTDGRRTLAEVIRAAQAELPGLDPNRIYDFYRYLALHGYIQFYDPDREGQHVEK
ncbi:MAG: M28 family peptidase [Anaerolineales bacterium]